MSSDSHRATLTAADPTATDPDKYKVIFENDKVRVLEYRDRPGDRTAPHHHPDFVLYALSSFRRTLTFPLEGKEVTRDVKAGDVLWANDQVHIGANVGNSETHVIMVEMKQAGAKHA